MGLLERAIRRGVSDAVGSAIGGAIRDAVTPVADKYATRAAQHIDDAAAAAGQTMQAAAAQTQAGMQEIGAAGVAAGAAAGAGAAGVAGAGKAPAGSGFAGLEASLGNWQRSMENFATQAAKNSKECPACGELTTADKKFCPSCGAKLPEQTVAQGAVCPACGTQNTIGTSFCQECGTKLPAALASEQAAAGKNAAVLAQWARVLPQYPVWNQGGSDYELECDGGYSWFTATFRDGFAASAAVEQYKEYLKQQGFRVAGEYMDRDHLYKKVAGVCYHVDFEHCFEGDCESPTVYFDISEPSGGFDYVKPAPQPQGKSMLGGFLDMLNR